MRGRNMRLGRRCLGERVLSEDGWEKRTGAIFVERASDLRPVLFECRRAARGPTKGSVAPTGRHDDLGARLKNQCPPIEPGSGVTLENK